jgi:prolipoprotein diacylglyceryltransferase
VTGAEIHVWLELLAYIAGAQWYRLNLRRSAALAPQPEPLQLWSIIAGAALGAALGAKLLYVLQYWSALQTRPLLIWLSGKTIVGGLLGGVAGVEAAKSLVGWKRSTGDHFVGPLLLGIAVGRLGCQFAGLDDLTYGGITSLPWGWNYGDGLPRHPVALYEVLGLLVLAMLLRRFQPPLSRVAGDRFRAFMMGYLLLRLLLDFLKPPHLQGAEGLLTPGLIAPFTAIQWACVAGLAYYLPAATRWRQRKDS